MAYRRKLTAFFISAAFILTLSLSFFFIAEELSHDHGHGSDPCPICEKIDLCLRTLSVCSSVTFPADNGESVSLPHLFSAVLSLSAFSLLTVSSTLVTLRVKLTD